MFSNNANTNDLFGTTKYSPLLPCGLFIAAAMFLASALIFAIQFPIITLDWSVRRVCITNQYHPLYDFWKDSSDTTTNIDVYFWNWTNPDHFPQFKLVGPYHAVQRSLKKDVKFDDCFVKFNQNFNFALSREINNFSKQHTIVLLDVKPEDKSDLENIEINPLDFLLGSSNRAEPGFLEYIYGRNISSTLELCAVRWDLYSEANFYWKEYDGSPLRYGGFSTYGIPPPFQPTLCRKRSPEPYFEIFLEKPFGTPAKLEYIGEAMIGETSVYRYSLLSTLNGYTIPISSDSVVGVKFSTSVVEIQVEPASGRILDFYQETDFQVDLSTIIMKHQTVKQWPILKIQKRITVNQEIIDYLTKGIESMQRAACSGLITCIIISAGFICAAFSIMCCPRLEIRRKRRKVFAGPEEEMLMLNTIKLRKMFGNG